MEMALAAIPLSKIRNYVRNWNKNGVGVKVIQSFSKDHKYRYYMNLNGQKVQDVPVPASVRHALESQGYRVENYRAGYAVKDSRTMKIGKLLAKHPEALKEFNNDPNRAGQGDYAIVVSCHPYDILGMSTGREWDQDSCMRIGVEGKYAKRNDGSTGSKAHHLSNDIAEGTLVAYAIGVEDTRKNKNIESPKARILIKPFLNAKKEVVWRVERKAYGAQIPGFKETVHNWLREVNKHAKDGVYKLPDSLYNDGIGNYAFVGRTDVTSIVKMGRDDLRDAGDIVSNVELVLQNSSDIVLRSRFPKIAMSVAADNDADTLNAVANMFFDFMEEHVQKERWPLTVFHILNFDTREEIYEIVEEFANMKYLHFFDYRKEREEWLDDVNFHNIAPCFDQVWGYLMGIRPDGRSLQDTTYMAPPPGEGNFITVTGEWVRSVVLAVASDKWALGVPPQIYREYDMELYEYCTGAAMYRNVFQTVIAKNFNWINAFRHEDFDQFNFWRLLYENPLMEHFLENGVSRSIDDTRNMGTLCELIAKTERKDHRAIERLITAFQRHPAAAEWEQLVNP